MAQNVFITGGSRGIGAAAVLAFAQNGDNVAFVWHSSRQAAEEVLRTAARLAPEGRFLAVTAAVRDAEEALGRLDVLVCNAGIAQQKLFTDLTD